MKTLKLNREETGEISLDFSKDLLKSDDADFVIFLQDAISAIQSQLLSVDMDQQVS
tara:strand:- start:666 stop:833 length:168 start_codon:yes stop_codon:yes gene_type:complete